MVAGLSWVKQQVADNGWPAVVSMSLGTGYSPTINDAVQDIISVRRGTANAASLFTPAGPVLALGMRRCFQAGVCRTASHSVPQHHPPPPPSIPPRPASRW